MASLQTHDTSDSQRAKRARFEARITAKQKILFLMAAEITGRTLTDFVLASAHETATRTVREHEAMTLSDRDRKAFVSALLNPPTPGKRLRKAVLRYKKRVEP